MLPDITGTAAKPPQISDMFQKFALAVKAKTFELFAEEDDTDVTDGLSLLDSAEEVIIGQRVVVLKPDGARDLSADSPQPTAAPELSLGEAQSKSKEYEESSKALDNRLEESCSVSPLEEPIEAPLRRTRTLNELEFKAVYAQMSQILISSIFATASSFEASYLQLQTAHAPFDEERIKSADKALVSHLQRLSDLKQFYRQFCKNPELGLKFPAGSCLEARVQENQSKLRTLRLISDRLQSDIDRKNNDVQSLRKKLGEIQRQNFRLSKRLSDNLSSSCEVSLTVQVFDTLLHDACRAIHKFTNILTDLMRRAGWDLDLAADSVYADVDYSENGHNRYAFLSYVCLGMFRGFDLNNYGIGETEIQEHVSGKNSSSLKKLLEHVSSNPMDVLSMDPDCEFAKFCDKKYQELIHPSMESSIFRNLDQKEAVLSSWRSLTVFYKSFVRMASSIWTLHKLAFSFDPVIEIFQVERGVEYSAVYMEDIMKRVSVPQKVKPKVGFTVVPGFRIGKTVVQSQVYLSGLKC